MISGTKLAHYEISTLLGKGGMGEVWRARDTKLGREVAIKTLPEEFAQDADRLARFEREAKLLASLNHPNIAAIHGFEEDKGTHFLVLELVEGDTLADRLKNGPVSIDDALPLSLQIVEALEAAHEKGVIHRDLKPANIKVTPDGKIKVLDFGLAKALTGDTLDVNPSQSPTLSMAATAEGVILGTAAYMSPEQARGVKVDKRADIWAFGCILYEMLTARQVFGGELMSDVMASVLKSDPNYQGLPPATPPRLRALLQRCLEKDPKQRWHDVGDLRVELQQATGDPQTIEPAGAQPRPGRSRANFAWAGSVLIALVAGWFGAVRFGPTSAVQPWADDLFHFTFGPPAGTIFDASLDQPFALAPDGNSIAFVAINAGGVSELWVLQFDSDVPQRLAGTEGARSPFWSPDSEWIGFYAPGAVRRVRPTGGQPSTITSISSGRRMSPSSATWAPDDTVLYQLGRPEAPFQRIDAQGGASTLSTPADAGPARFPLFLNDGERFIYSRLAGNLVETFVASLSGSAPVQLFEGAALAYAQGSVFYVDDEALFVREFDEGSTSFSGDSQRLVDGIPESGPQRTPLSVSRDGVLAYQENPSGYETVFRWYDREGNHLGDVLEEPRRYHGFSASPNGSRIALSLVAADGSADLYILDMVSGNETRRTFLGDVYRPIWSVDGTQLVFSGYDEVATPPNLMLDVLSEGSGIRRLTTASSSIQMPTGWTPDADAVVYEIWNDDGTTDLATFWIEDSREELLPINSDDFNEWAGVVSPDGNWIAYATDLSGQEQVWVARFPSGDDAAPISRGTYPQWRGDGEELFYVSNEQQMMAVSVDITDDGVSAATPSALFPLENAVGWFFDNMETYSVTEDGQRFLVGILADIPQPPIHVIFNWPALLE